MPIKDEAGNPIVKTYDAADWTSGSAHNFISDATAFTPEDYAAYTSSSYADDVPNWWSGGNHSDGVNTQNRILYVTEQNLSRQHADVVRGIHGYEITSMTNSNGSISISRSGGNTTNNVTESDNVYKVYILYKKQVQVHDVDASGTELGTRTGNWSVGYYGANRWDGTTFNKDRNNWDKTINSYTGSDLTASTEYGSRTKIYVKYTDTDNVERTADVSEADISNFRITWQFEGPKEWNTSTGLITDDATTRAGYHWKTRVYTGTGDSDYVEINGLITDVYMEYENNELSVTVHHVDKNGNEVATDTTLEPVSGEENTVYKVAKEQSNNFQYAPVSGKAGSDFSSANSFSSITYTSTDGNWADNIGEGNTLHKELWIVYTPSTPTLHHVDADGHQIAADQTPYSIGNNRGAYENKWNGSSNVINNNSNHNAASGWQGAHAGSYDSETVYTSGGIWYKYDTGTGVWHTAIGTVDNSDKVGNSGYSKVTSTATGAESGTSGEINANDPKFISDFYQVYSGVKGITVHHVDSAGKKLADDTYTSVSLSGGAGQLDVSGITKVSKEGYTYQNAYVDKSRTKPFAQLTFGLDGWGYRTAVTDVSSIGLTSYSQEVWLVYSSTPKLNRHYGYMTNSTTDTSTIFNAFSSEEAPSAQYPGILEAASSDTGTPVAPTGTAASVTHDGTSYSYVASYLATPKSSSDASPDYIRLGTDALKVSHVRVKNGKTQYQVVTLDPQDMTMLRRNRWGYTTDAGRTYTLRKEGNHLSIVYSLGGTGAFDLNLTGTAINGGNTVNTYTATSNSEGRGVIYTVTETIVSGSANPTYQIAVSEWVENAQKNLYHVYQPSSAATVNVDNEVVYTGNLIARVEGLPEGATITSYEWQKSDNTVVWWKL